MPIRVSAATLPIEPPVNAPEKAAEMFPSPWTLCPVEDLEEADGFGLAQPWLLQPSLREEGEGQLSEQKISLSLLF